MNDAMETLARKRLERIEELERTIAELREHERRALKAIQDFDPHDRLPPATFDRYLAALERNALNIGERIADLERRRDALLAGSDVEALARAATLGGARTVDSQVR